MTEDGKPKPLTLEGETALDLWRQGRDAWNRWIDQHPHAMISFAGVDFSSERDSEGDLSFANYHFGNGHVYFSGATFGDGNLNFSKATFGDGYVDFSNANFGDGGVNFSKATFGNGGVDFSESTFGNGDVDFSKVSFGNGYVSYYRAIFGNGNITFFDAIFSTGEVSFLGADFGNGHVDFFGADFGTGVVILSETTLGAGKLVLANASATTFLFDTKHNELEAIEAQGLLVKRWSTLKLSRTDTLKSVDIQGASFEGPLFVSGGLGIVPDLRSTRSTHQVELGTLTVKLRRAWQGFSWPLKLSPVALDPKDAARLRRLKEIAETNKDHQAALRFSADENRARRWIETSWFGSVLDMTFSACSNYGQSILRPFAALSLLAAFSVGLYKKLAVATFTAWWTDPGWGQSLLLSISNSLPFLPQSRDLREDALKALYPGDPSLTVDALMITQGILSFVFLFLIGLGLRNRFRL